MLQQTRVATVIPYFERFLARFPTLAALAAADEATVLSLWSGLGYYRRARGLHRGAAEIVERFGGEMPRTVEALLTIRGIGPYTAGAIASLAYDVQTPLVDGNVIRVFARVFGLEDDMRRPAAQQRVWTLAREAVPADRPGAFNEALMELGATVCLPREPLCLVCPLAAICVARREDKTRSLPVISKAKAVKEVHAAALLVRDDRGVLLARRRGDALFGGLWEPPMIEADSAQAARQAIKELAPEAIDAGEITHVLTHRKMFVSVLADTVRAQAPAYPALGDVYDDARMVAEADLEGYGISTLARKVMAAVTKKAPKTAGRSRATKNRLGPSPCSVAGEGAASSAWRVRPCSPASSARVTRRPTSAVPTCICLAR